MPGEPASESARSFADALDSALTRDGTPPDPALPVVGEAIAAFRAGMAAIDNVGRTGDDRDLYVHVDALVAAVRASTPGSLCRAGCSGCCDSQTAVFDVTATEWAAIADHVATKWTDAWREAFLARFATEHGPRLWAYRLLGLIGHFEPLADRYFDAKPYRCPFLDGGLCTIYSARPLACRAYGHFAARARWKVRPTVYACNMQTAHFETLRATRAVHLPALITVLAKLNRLDAARWPKRRKILPLWIAAELPGG